MRYILLLAPLLFLLGCCPECKPDIQYVDRYVEVPVACETPSCVKPTPRNYKDSNVSYTENAVRLKLNQVDDANYTSCLEDANKVCKKK